jgi:hypothetical protein
VFADDWLVPEPQEEEIANADQELVETALVQSPQDDVELNAAIQKIAEVWGRSGVDLDLSSLRLFDVPGCNRVIRVPCEGWPRPIIDPPSGGAPGLREFWCLHGTDLYGLSKILGDGYARALSWYPPVRGLLFCLAVEFGAAWRVRAHDKVRLMGRLQKMSMGWSGIMVQMRCSTAKKVEVLTQGGHDREAELSQQGHVTLYKPYKRWSVPESSAVIETIYIRVDRWLACGNLATIDLEDL